jgi:hypothetical protein
MELRGMLSNRLISRLRVGSVLGTQKGKSYRVIEPVVQVAPNGGLVPALLLERTEPGHRPKTVLMAVGALINLMRAGVRHKPGPGAAIDWARVQHRSMPGDNAVLRRPPPLVRTRSPDTEGASPLTTVKE